MLNLPMPIGGYLVQVSKRESQTCPGLGQVSDAERGRRCWQVLGGIFGRVPANLARLTVADELVAFGDSDDDATQMQLTARMNSEMQGDLDFDMELEDELSISDAVLLSDGDRLMHSRISHEEVEAAREAILAHEDLESQIRVVQSELEAEQEARKSAELDALAVAADRDTLRRLLDAEKAARAADVAQRDATIEHLQLEMRKSRNAQVRGAGGSLGFRIILNIRLTRVCCRWRPWAALKIGRNRSPRLMND